MRKGEWTCLFPDGHPGKGRPRKPIDWSLARGSNPRATFWARK